MSLKVQPHFRLRNLADRKPFCGSPPFDLVTRRCPCVGAALLVNLLNISGILCQRVLLSGIAVLFMLLNRALAGCVNLDDFLDSDKIVPNQALLQPALEKIGEITPSRIYSHAETGAGLARGSRIKGGYLRQFAARPGHVVGILIIPEEAVLSGRKQHLEQFSDKG
jgi:hypothetical protein